MAEGSLSAVARALAAQLAVFQAVLLGASALHKAISWAQLREVAWRFARVPRSMAAAALSTALIAESCAGAMLISVEYRAAGALLAASIWTGYLLLILRAILEDRRDVDCGCSFGRVSRPLGAFQVWRNVLLAGLAILVWVSARSGGDFVQASQVLAGFALLALYAALDQVMGLRSLRRGEVA